MNNLISLLNSSYDIRVKKVITIQKNVTYLIKTQDKSYYFKNSFKDRDNIFIQQLVMDHLRANNFNNFIEFIKNNEGLPYTKYNGSVYFLTAYINDKEINIEKRSDIINTITQLGKFHRCSKNFDYKDSKKSILVKNTSELLIILEKFKKSKKQIDKLKKKDLFDIHNMKYHTVYLEKGVIAIAQLKKLSYDKFELQAIANNNLCHNLLKEESFIIKNNAIYITNFSKVCVGCQVNDIVKFIKRYLTKNIFENGNQPIPIDELLEYYNKVSPIDDGTIKIIKILCLFPLDYFELIINHYEKTRGVNFGMVNAKLEEISRLDNLITSYINY